MREFDEFKALSLEEKALTVRKLRTDTRKLEAVSAESGTAKSAIEKYVRAIGKNRAETVIASLVNESAYDCRICRAAKDWAKRIENAWDAKAMDNMGVSVMMHMVHLDQLAFEMSRYTK